MLQKELRIFVWRVNQFDRYGRHKFSPNEDNLYGKMVRAE